MLLLFFKPHMPVNFYELSQSLGTHFVIILSRCMIRALNSMHRDAAGTQDSLYFGEHRILFFEANVTDDIEADYIIESLICKGKVRQFTRHREVIAVPARRQ